jgi:hypothetical protein
MASIVTGLLVALVAINQSGQDKTDRRLAEHEKPAPSSLLLQ